MVRLRQQQEGLNALLPSIVHLKKNEVIYDVASFLNKHPGGRGVLLRNEGKDVGVVMRGHPHKHSRMAYSLLEEYRTQSEDQSTEDDPLVKEKNRVESKVDWSRGMVKQVASLGQDYKHWLEFPVDRRLHLFDSPVLERLTRTPWFLVPLVWGPVIVLNVAMAVRCSGSFWDLPNLFGIALGLLVWSLLEYLLHRFLFHMSVPSEGTHLIVMHFLLHGLHHKVPYDEDRLVFPPLGVLIISMPLYLLVRAVLPWCMAHCIVAGGFAGYVTYDLCHYYLHHGNPRKDSFLHRLKRYHAHHHFVHDTQGFGITSNLWDSFFGTAISMKEIGRPH